MTRSKASRRRSRSLSSSNGWLAGGMDAPQPYVAEAVQHVRPASHPFDQGVVVDLVEEEARFLPLQEINHHVQTVDRHGGFGRDLPADDGTFPWEAFPLAYRRIVACHDRPRSQDLFDGRADEIASAVHAGGQELDRYRVAVAVHDQPGEAVGFSVDDPIR